ncbi:outer membrane protein assembly factor BamB [Nocardiopsis arvandica]|uniref:Outer membrane protein assembly factor BamB n=1 Tax=Nocardiopsis sinuspersici TaxID=501010 RepID=A0A7Y9XHA9_9ACTN|nr:PQQ-binding-like beta-propeller repeat protein [Nocardiopsis sinuspersici]NYH55769.1 outer membrane protein assembly factor BamB [Nocardiopsis sinuspersici]
MSARNDTSTGFDASRSPTPSHRGCRRWFLGCLVVPLSVLLVAVLVLSIVKGLQNGHIAPFAEIQGSPLWSAEGTEGEVVGGWATTEAAIYGAEGGLTALDTETGDELWRLDLPGTVCGMSDEALDGFGVVLLEGDTEEEAGPDEEDAPARSCDVALLVDTTTGEEVWRTDPLADEAFEQAGLLFSSGSRSEQVGDQVLVRAGGELVGLDGGSGEELWRRGEFRAGEALCPAADFLARRATEVVVVADCGIDGSVTVHVADAATGEDVSAFEFPRGRSQPNMDSVRRTRLVATDPVHVAIDLGHHFGAGSEGYAPDSDGEPHENEPVLAFDDDGTLRHEIDVGASIFGPPSRESAFVVDDGRLYTNSTNPSCTNDIRAHDLDTGELLWETGVGDPGPQVVDVRDDKLLVMLDGDGSFGECSMLGPEWDWQLYTMDTATGQEEPLSAPLAGVRQPRATELWWRGDRIFQLEHPIGDGPGEMTAYR